MLKNIRNYFQRNIFAERGASPRHAPERALQLAAASLLIEVARSDYHIDRQERQAIVDAIAQMFSLSRQETHEIVELAESEMEDATCLFEVTRLVNEHFDYSQKLSMIEMMWQVTYADQDKHKYEEHLVRKICDLIHVSHADFIRLRHQVSD